MSNTSGSGFGGLNFNKTTFISSNGGANQPAPADKEQNILPGKLQASNSDQVSIKRSIVTEQAAPVVAKAAAPTPSKNDVPAMRDRLKGLTLAQIGSFSIDDLKAGGYVQDSTIEKLAARA